MHRSFQVMAVGAGALVMVACPLSWARSGIVASVHERQSVSASSIQQHYRTLGASVIAMVPFGRRYDLVDYTFPTLANRFDLWDTASRRIVPVGAAPLYTTLDRILSPTDILLYADGRSSEDLGWQFPFIVEAVRSDTDAAFRIVRHKRYVPLTKGAVFGNRPARLSGVVVTANGITAEFGPKPNQGATFYAGSTYIPRTQISYNPTSRQMTVRWKDTEDGDGHDSVAGSNPFVQSVRISQVGSDCLLVLRLAPRAGYYTGDSTWADTNQHVPMMELSFAARAVDEGAG